MAYSSQRPQQLPQQSQQPGKRVLKVERSSFPFPAAFVGSKDLPCAVWLLFPISHSLLDLLLSWEVGLPLSVVSFPSLSSELAGGGNEVDLSLTKGLPGEFKARIFPWVCLHLLQGKPFPHSLAGGGGRGRIYFPKSGAVSCVQLRSCSIDTLFWQVYSQ